MRINYLVKAIIILISVLSPLWLTMLLFEIYEMMGISVGPSMGMGSIFIVALGIPLIAVVGTIIWLICRRMKQSDIITVIGYILPMIIVSVYIINVWINNPYIR